MPNAKRPAGPARPLNQKRDAVEEREELDELRRDSNPSADEAADPTRSARHAERDALGSDDSNNQVPRR